jgi:hypothetical protein
LYLLVVAIALNVTHILTPRVKLGNRGMLFSPQPKGFTTLQQQHYFLANGRVNLQEQHMAPVAYSLQQKHLASAGNPTQVTLAAAPGVRTFSDLEMKISHVARYDAR